MSFSGFKRITIGLLSVVCLSSLAASPLLAAVEDSGLPLPRFVSLRASQVNMRTGPGVQYPVDWVYQRAGLPVEIIAEYRTWRKIRDWQSTQGWVHQSMLSGKRMAIVTGKKRTLRKDPDTKSPGVALIESGAIADLTKCPTGGGWCRLESGNINGWLRKVEFWGAYRDEVLK
ncbi:MAG: SH3 domain-containing protein [Alphaproteobacteria bacterium]